MIHVGTRANCENLAEVTGRVRAKSAWSGLVVVAASMHVAVRQTNSWTGKTEHHEALAKEENDHHNPRYCCRTHDRRVNFARRIEKLVVDRLSI